MVSNKNQGKPFRPFSVLFECIVIAEPKESMLINPLDLIVTVFRCCSQPLKQALAAKMYTCRLAIPILLPRELSFIYFSNSS
jgi:hypothetical protein